MKDLRVDDFVYYAEVLDYDESRHQVIHPEVCIERFKVLKITPNGFVINHEGHNRKCGTRWLSFKTKRYGLTEEESIKSLRYRKSLAAKYAYKRFKRACASLNCVQESLGMDEEVLPWPEPQWTKTEEIVQQKFERERRWLL